MWEGLIVQQPQQCDQAAAQSSSTKQLSRLIGLQSELPRRRHFSLWLSSSDDKLVRTSTTTYAIGYITFQSSTIDFNISPSGEVLSRSAGDQYQRQEVFLATVNDPTRLSFYLDQRRRGRTAVNNLLTSWFLVVVGAVVVRLMMVITINGHINRHGDDDKCHNKVEWAGEAGKTSDCTTRWAHCPL